MPFFGPYYSVHPGDNRQDLWMIYRQEHSPADKTIHSQTRNTIGLNLPDCDQ